MVLVATGYDLVEASAEAVGLPPKKRAPRRMPIETPAADDIQAVFGTNLRIARLQRHLTLEEVATRSGTTFQYLSKVENGHANLTLAMSKRLAAAVGRSISSLMRPSSYRIKRPGPRN